MFYTVAAGGSAADACNYSPQSAAEAFVVAATTSADARASFSNWGPCIDVFAPGSSITSAWSTSDTATNTPDHWSYTQKAICNYDTGLANSGTMTSHGWGLYGFNCLRIKFRHYWKTESWPGPYDQHAAELSLDGGLSYSKLLDYKDARDPSSGGLWVEVDSGGISIPSSVSTKVRFRFDTVDGVYNDYLGCYVDDVELWAGW